MERYKNSGGKSNVVAYEIGPDFVSICFADGGKYIYTNQSAGLANIEKMKQLALTGQGVNSFINRVVSNRYESKGRCY